MREVPGDSPSPERASCYCSPSAAAQNLVHDLDALFSFPMAVTGYPGVGLAVLVDRVRAGHLPRSFIVSQVPGNFPVIHYVSKTNRKRKWTIWTI